MKKTHPTAQHCLTDAPGEQARVALFCAAEHGHVAGGKKHGSGGRFCWPDSKKLVNGGLLGLELSTCGDLDLDLSVAGRVLTPVGYRWLLEVQRSRRCGHRAKMADNFVFCHDAMIAAAMRLWSEVR
jgi:hypothetical protein